MHHMGKRAKAVEGCMTRFAFKPVEPGVRDCLKLAAHAMHHMGRSTKKISDWEGRSWADGYRYIQKKKCADLVELMDKALPKRRIAPAAALPGDIIALPADDERFGCSLAVALDNGRVLALNAESGLIEPMMPRLFVCAWRL